MTSNWFALQVRPRRELTISAMLRAKGYEEFLPLRRSHRAGCAIQPLFTGYVFCRLSPGASGRFVTTPGVIRIVSFGGKPVPVDSEEIAALQLVDKSGCANAPLQGLHLGDKVVIDYGPLRGLCGVLSSVRGQHRLLISVTAMGRTVAVEVDPNWIIRDGKTQQSGCLANSDQNERVHTASAPHSTSPHLVQ
jgi:transcription antitermination factor NusG